MTREAFDIVPDMDLENMLEPRYVWDLVAEARLESAALRTQLAEVTGEKQKYFDLLADACEKTDRLQTAIELLSIAGDGLRTELATVTRERDRMREVLVECAVPLEVLHAIDCDLSPATQAGIGKAVTAIRAALFSAHPEPKPEAPKCEKCSGTGRVPDTSGYVDFMMCQVCRMHTGKEKP